MSARAFAVFWVLTDRLRDYILSHPRMRIRFLRLGTVVFSVFGSEVVLQNSVVQNDICLI